MDGWNTTFLLGPGLFSGAFAVSFREGSSTVKYDEIQLLGSEGDPQHHKIGNRNDSKTISERYQ